MIKTIRFFRTEIADNSAKSRIMVVLGILLFFGTLTVLMSFV